MSPNTFDVVNDGLLLIANRQPLDVFTSAGPGTAADVAESVRRQFGGLQTRSQQSAHDIIGEERHSAISMMDDKEFARSKQLVADDEGADRIVAGAAAGAANYVCIPFGEAGIFGGIEPRIHASENREAASWRQSQFAFLSEGRAIFPICLENFRQYLAQGNLLV